MWCNPVAHRLYLVEGRRLWLSIDRTLADSFTNLAKEIEPKLRHALVAAVGPQRAVGASSEAMAYAWEHWDRVSKMDNPAGYLYRVARSMARRRRLVPPRLPAAPDMREPWIEPGLPEALRKLSARQRAAVILVHSFGYTHAETADLLGISRSSVQNHVGRGLNRLRQEIGVIDA